jgi:hypothetical protein
VTTADGANGAWRFQAHLAARAADGGCIERTLEVPVEVVGEASSDAALSTASPQRGTV